MENDLYKYFNNPELINSDLSEDLKIRLIDLDNSLLKKMEPYSEDFLRKVFDTQPSAFKFMNMSIITPDFLNEIISKKPRLLKYVYNPSVDLIKLAVIGDPYVIEYLDQPTTEVLEFVVEKNGLYLQYLNKTQQNENIVRKAIRNNPASYKFSYIRNSGLELEVLNQDPKLVEIVDGLYPEFIDYYIDHNPNILKEFIKKEIPLTEKAIEKSLEINPWLFQLLPEVYKTTKNKKIAVKTDIDVMYHIGYDKEILEYALSVDGRALKFYQPKDIRTILKAIDNDVRALDYVESPRSFLAEYAFEKDGYGLKYLKNPTSEQQLDAVSRNGEAIKFVPLKDQTKNMQMYAMAGYGAPALKYIEPIDAEVYLEAVRLEPAYIFEIKNPTNEYFKTAFSSSGQLMLYYPDWKTRFNSDVKTSALSEDGSLLRFMDEISKTMALAAVESYPAALEWVERQDLDIAKAAVETDKQAIFLVDPEVMDEELLDLLLELDPDYFERTSGEMTWEEWKEKINN